MLRVDSMNISEAIKAVGGPVVVGKACGLSTRAIYKWDKNCSLPRTEFTGETSYSEVIAGLPGSTFTAKELRDNSRPDAQRQAS